MNTVDAEVRCLNLYLLIILSLQVPYRLVPRELINRAKIVLCVIFLRLVARTHRYVIL